MKTTLVLLLLLPLGSQAQKAPDIPRLSGIVNLPELKEAVFEFASVPWDSPRQAVLHEGWSWWQMKVVEILPQRKTVKITVEGKEAPMTLTLSNQSGSVSGPAETIELANCSLHSLLELYGEFSQRTLLHWPTLPSLSFSLSAAVSNQVQAARILEEALAEKEVATVADGDKFTMIVPKQEASAIRTHAPRPKPLESSQSHPQELLPSGIIKFHGTSIEQVFHLYAELVGGHFDFAAPMPKITQHFIFLYTQSPMSKEEVQYAFDTLFEWQNIKVVPGENGSFKAVNIIK